MPARPSESRARVTRALAKADRRMLRRWRFCRYQWRDDCNCMPLMIEAQDLITCLHERLRQTP